MDYFAQQLINGLVLGSICGLIAIGYTMVYGIVGMINFAHGDIFMMRGFIALISFLVLVSFGLTAVPVILLIVLLVSMAITALYGWTVERIAYRPLRHVVRAVQLFPGRARRARKPGAADHHRRLYAAPRRERLRGPALQHPDRRRDYDHRAACHFHLA